MEFQIEQNFGDGCKGYLYFESDSDKIDVLESLAKEEALKDWKNVNPALYFSPPSPCRPTVIISEFKDGRKVKGGIRFKTKWR